MKEVIEFRIYNEYTHLLLEPSEGKRNSFNTIIHITKDDPKFEQIRFLYKQIREEKNDFFFMYSEIKRKYSKKELDTATLLQMKIKTTFEPAGEECGTLYDETVACEICGANRKQISPLTLKKGSIPKKDIARTIAGEVLDTYRFGIEFSRYSNSIFASIHCTGFCLALECRGYASVNQQFISFAKLLMKQLRDSIFFIIATMLFFCCASNKSMETCEIKKVLKVVAKNNDSYYMLVKFTPCTSKESREALMKDEIKKRFPSIGNRIVHVDEYIGKMYCEYGYEIKIE